MAYDREDGSLEGHALEIATEHWLKKKSFRQLGDEYGYSASTMCRTFETWVAAGRFSVIDTRRGSALVRVHGTDDVLEQRLAKNTSIFRAKVARISGVEAACSFDCLKGDQTSEAQRAYEAGDELHKALGEVAAEYLSYRIGKGWTIGLSSGRGIGFTVMKLGELALRERSRLSGCETVHIVSLCGGSHVAPWVITTDRPLDANENVFHLAAILEVPRENITYMDGWTAAETDDKKHHTDFGKMTIDLAVVGIGQLNTRHHFFHRPGVQLEAIAKPLKRIRDRQAEDPSLMDRIAETCHRLFPVGLTPLDPDLLADIHEINEAIVAVPPSKLKNDKPQDRVQEIIMVAGGAQKVNAIFELVTGGCPEAPVSLDHLTLVTDTWTANEVLNRIRQRDKDVSPAKVQE